MLLKLLLTPSLIAVATLAARRWGPTRGGWVAGLPLVSGPLSAFLALEQGPLFAARAARAGLFGLVGVSAFCIVYIKCGRRRSPVAPAVFGIGACFVVLWGLARVRWDLAPSTLLAVLLMISVYLAAGRTEPEERLIRASYQDLPLRMASATALVVVVTESARFLGAAWSGLLSPFPVFASIMAIFTHRQEGPLAAFHLLKGVIVGSFSSAAFLFAVALLLPRCSLAFTYGLAASFALAVNWLSLTVLLKRGA